MSILIFFFFSPALSHCWLTGTWESLISSLCVSWQIQQRLLLLLVPKFIILLFVVLDFIHVLLQLQVILFFWHDILILFNTSHLFTSKIHEVMPIICAMCEDSTIFFSPRLILDSLVSFPFEHNSPLCPP